MVILDVILILSFIVVVASTNIIELIRFPANGSAVTSSYVEYTVILHTHRLSINLSDVQCHLNCLHHQVLKICTTTDYSQDCRNVTKSVYSYTMAFSKESGFFQALSFQVFLRTSQGMSMIGGVSHLLVEERNITWRLVNQSLPAVHQFVSIVQQQQPSSKTGWFIGSLTEHHRELLLSLSLKDMRMIVGNDLQLPLCETSVGVYVTCCSLSSPRGNTTAGDDGSGAESASTTIRRLDSCLAPSADVGILVLDMNSTVPMLPNYLDLVNAAVNTVRGTLFVFTTSTTKPATAIARTTTTATGRTTGRTAMQPLSDTLKYLPASLRERCTFVTLLDMGMSMSDNLNHYDDNSNKEDESTTTTRAGNSGSGGQDSANIKSYYSCTRYRVSMASIAVSDMVSTQV